MPSENVKAWDGLDLEADANATTAVTVDPQYWGMARDRNLCVIHFEVLKVSGSPQAIEVLAEDSAGRIFTPIGLTGNSRTTKGLLRRGQETRTPPPRCTRSAYTLWPGVRKPVLAGDPPLPARKTGPEPRRARGSAPGPVYADAQTPRSSPSRGGDGGPVERSRLRAIVPAEGLPSTTVRSDIRAPQPGHRHSSTPNTRVNSSAQPNRAGRAEGFLWPKLDPQVCGYRLAVTGAIAERALDLVEMAGFAARFLLERYPAAVAAWYQLPSPPPDEWALLDAVGRRRGFLNKGGVVDQERAATRLLHDLREGAFGRISLETPEDLPEAGGSSPVQTSTA